MFLSITITELLQVAPLLGLAQGLILAALLWFNRQVEHRKTIFLVLHLVTMSLVMAIPLVQNFMGYASSWLLDALVLVIYQGLYLYIKSFQRPIQWQDVLVHYGVLVLVFPFSYLCYHQWATYQLVNGEPEIQHSASYTILSILKFLLAAVYAYASLKLLKKHLRLSQEHYSNISAVSLEWVNRLLYLSFILIGLAILFYALSATIPGLSIRITNLFAYLCMTAYLYYAFVKGVSQKPISQLSVRTDVLLEVETSRQPVEPNHKSTLNQEVLEVSQAIAEVGQTPKQYLEPEKTKYQRSTLNQEMSKSILQRMEVAMRHQKLYLEPELTLPMLTEVVKAPTYHISQVLSEQFGKNFYEYINYYRVEEAKRLLLDPAKKHFTILAIAFESGFNSKTTFNKVFKRFTGLTPSEFVSVQTKQKATA